MAILLSDLLKEISISVNNANSIMEHVALNQYMDQNYNKLEDQGTNGSEVYKPLTFDIVMQEEKQTHEIPVAALLHNTTMSLEQVDIKLKFRMKEDEGEIYIDCNTAGIPEESLSEMTLSYKNDHSSEGIAKMTDNHLKRI